LLESSAVLSLPIHDQCLHKYALPLLPPPLPRYVTQLLILKGPGLRGASLKLEKTINPQMGRVKHNDGATNPAAAAPATVKVIVRLRPLLPIEEDHTTDMVVVEGNSIIIKPKAGTSNGVSRHPTSASLPMASRCFGFNRIFGQSSTQVVICLLAVVRSLGCIQPN